MATSTRASSSPCSSGGAFATSKMLVLEVPPEVGAALRFGFGSLLLMAILFRRAAASIPSRPLSVRIGALMLLGVWLVNRP